ncbi:MAG: hypothetical protein E6J14_15180 [Chloroflexi bacterium]|nr:MAG: hypothetical protein E6J14_15180 [Chloroflexota bacterium]
MAINSLAWTPTPIAADGSLKGGGQPSTQPQVQAQDTGGFGIPQAPVYLSFAPAPVTSGAPASATATCHPSTKTTSTIILNPTPASCITDDSGTVQITYTSASVPPSSGRDVLTAQDAASQPAVSATDTYSYVVIGQTAKVTVTLSPASIPANGTSTAQALAVVTDANNNRVPSETIRWNTDGDVSFGGLVNHGDGTHTATITASRTSGPETITATAGNGVHGSAVLTETASSGSTSGGGGYWLVASDGGVFSFSAPFHGSTGNIRLNQPIVGIAGTPGPGGYWLVASDGGVFSFGDAGFHGSTGNRRLNQSIVGMASTPDGGGYWLVASDGGVFSFGNAQFRGSTGNIHLAKPVVGMAAMPDGSGYWLVASDGGVFAFGKAGFFGSTGGMHLNKPIVGMAATPDGGGYWLVASDGGIFAFGNAAFRGSTGNLRLNQPVVGMSRTGDGGGYWLVASDGGIFSFGNAPFQGSTGGMRLNRPVVGMAAA